MNGEYLRSVRIARDVDIFAVQYGFHKGGKPAAAVSVFWAHLKCRKTCRNVLFKCVTQFLCRCHKLMVHRFPWSALNVKIPKSAVATMFSAATVAAIIAPRFFEVWQQVFVAPIQISHNVCPLIIIIWVTASKEHVIEVTGAT